MLGRRSPSRAGRPGTGAFRLRQQRRRHDRRHRRSGGGKAIVSNPANGKVTLTIGSKNFTEQIVLGEIYSQALEAAGYKVKKDLNLGSETVALQALKAGRDLRLSGVREHRADLVLRGRPGEGPGQARRRPTRRPTADFKKEGLEAFPPTPFASANAVGTLTSTAEKLGLEGHLRPEGQVAEPDPLRLPGVPPADRLPARPAEVLRAAVQVVHPGGHRAALRGPRQGPGRPLDPVHDRRPARGAEEQVRDPQRRQARLPGGQRHLRHRPGDGERRRAPTTRRRSSASRRA